MITTYIARNLKKHPFLNLIKIIGLALGLSGILFITLFLKNEFTYDAYHSKADRIYRFTATNPNFLKNTHFARLHNADQVPDLAAYFPEIENYIRLAPLRGGVIKLNEKFYNINQAFVCDSTFFTVFDAELIIGNPATILDAPGSMVITQSFAKKVFGDKNPVGQVMTIPTGQFYGEEMNFTVKGVMKDYPQNSHFHPDFITTSTSGVIDWWAFSYFLLHKNANPENITSRYKEFLDHRDNQQSGQPETKAYMQKITDIHLHSDKLREIENNGNMANIYVLAVAAVILLMISIGNYASLNTGMANFNQKFIQVNRILGSTKNTNLRYFTLESIIILGFCLLLSILIIIPANFIIQKRYTINLFEDNGWFAVSIMVIFGILSLIAGVQSVFKNSLKQVFSSTNTLLSLKTKISKGIIITQYTLAIVLIASVVVISRQTNYALTQSMGVKENNIICLESVHSKVQSKFEIFKSELLKHNSVESVSAMMEPPGGEANDMFNFELEGYVAEDDEKNRIGVFPCDYSFASLFDLEFLGGDNFSKHNMDVEGSGEYIINESAMRYMDLATPEEAVGKNFKLLFGSPFITIPSGKIIGVVKDFHLSTIKKKVNPLVLFKRDSLWLINFVIAYKPTMRDAALDHIKSVWENMYPEYPFDFKPVDAMYRNVYSTELLQARLLTIFTIIALFISSMGLLGISLLVSQQRIKEIGIRKVNGAKIAEVMALLNKSFVYWVSISFVLATPLAWYAMKKWLEGFVYRIELSWWIFILSGVLALFIVLLTVSWQSWRAARKNPVEALRYE